MVNRTNLGHVALVTGAALPAQATATAQGLIQTAGNYVVRFADPCRIRAARRSPE